MNASKYEDYNDTSATYDGARMPIDAADLKATIEGVAASTGKPLASLRVLDSGCGTANYIAALSAVLPCRFVGVDGSEGMIAQARKKFAGRANVSLSCQDITKMTFEAGSLDVVMTTQVVHHLQTPNAEDPEQPPKDWGTLRALVGEIARVLTPGGAWWCQTSTPEQQRVGFWWGAVIPRAARMLGARFPELP